LHFIVVIGLIVGFNRTGIARCREAPANAGSA
jgi:hypothetical protein